jgi:hypothetical protein
VPQEFAINATAFLRITRADWDSDAAGQGLDGNTPRLRWVRHTWQTNVLTAFEFDTLYAFEGQTVDLLTTNRDDRNADFIVYTGAICESVSGQHNGPIFESVRAEFLVRLE